MPGSAPWMPFLLFPVIITNSFIVVSQTEESDHESIVRSDRTVIPIVDPRDLFC